MGQTGITYKEVKVINASDGAITASTTYAPSALNQIGFYRECWCVIKTTDQDLPGAGDAVDVFIQTTFDSGNNWVDVENIHFENGTAVANRDDNETGTWVAALTGAMISTTARETGDATIDADTKLDIGFGSGLRVKIVVANAGNITCDFYVHLKP